MIPMATAVPIPCPLTLVLINIRGEEEREVLVSSLPPCYVLLADSRDGELFWHDEGLSAVEPKEEGRTFKYVGRLEGKAGTYIYKE